MPAVKNFLNHLDYLRFIRRSEPNYSYVSIKIALLAFSRDAQMKIHVLLGKNTTFTGKSSYPFVKYSFSGYGFLSLIKTFFIARRVKQCNVLHVHLAGSMFGPFNLFLPLFYLVVRYPHGPSIITSGKITHTLFVREIVRQFADFVLSELPDDLTGLYKKAFFANGCGHPTWIFRSGYQKERLIWLKKNAGGKIFEVGCATGFILNYLGGGTGIDIDKLRIEYAKQRYTTSKFYVADATRMPFKKKEFDTVMLPEILEHVPFNVARKIVAESRRIGKKLLITVPNAEKKNYDRNLVENPEHLWYPTQKLMETLVPDGKIATSPGKDFFFVIV